MINLLKEKLNLARMNKLSSKDIGYLLDAIKLSKSTQRKCDIAIALSFVKNEPQVIKPIIKLLPLWSKSSYSGNSITTYSRLIVNYFNGNKDIFLKLLYSDHLAIRRIIAHAFYFTILADGVDNKKAWKLYRSKFRKILTQYVKREKNKKYKDFVENFLIEYR